MDVFLVIVRLLAFLISAVCLFCMSLGIFLLAHLFRWVGQEIVDTGLTPKHWFLNTPPYDVPTSEISGHVLKLAGLMGYILAASIPITFISALLGMILTVSAG